jgi:hypothetical protein
MHAKPVALLQESAGSCMHLAGYISPRTLVGLCSFTKDKWGAVEAAWSLLMRGASCQLISWHACTAA